jgi:hypothetical protein
MLYSQASMFNANLACYLKMRPMWFGLLFKFTPYLIVRQLHDGESVLGRRVCRPLLPLARQHTLAVPWLDRQLVPLA